MPIYNGLDVLQEIKQDSNLKKIPVIILTTSSNHKDIDKAYEHLANSYVIKPIDMDEYLKTIRTIEEFWLKLSKQPV